MILRQREPENLEFPFNKLNSVITPTSQFYVRSHFAAPKLDASTWRLKVEGAVSTPLELSLAELKSLPSVSKIVTMECAGNSRVHLVPAARGVLWDLGAVSTASWTGVRLSDILKQAGIDPDAVEVVLEGADRGEMKDPPKPGGALNYARSLPLSKAMQDDVILVTEMNGQPLSTAHGFPVRALVPGWFGMASVKWLTRIIVVKKSYNGYFQTIDYAYWEQDGSVLRRVPITAMLVKSQIAQPEMHETVVLGKSCRISGAAWAGEQAIAKVEVSVDGGKTWKEARATTKREPKVWTLWAFDWTPTEVGKAILMSRATDEKGAVQPAMRDLNRENYMINHTFPIEVEVVRA